MGNGPYPTPEQLGLVVDKGISGGVHDAGSSSPAAVPSSVLAQEGELGVPAADSAAPSPDFLPSELAAAGPETTAETPVVTQPSPSKKERFPFLVSLLAGLGTIGWLLRRLAGFALWIGLGVGAALIYGEMQSAQWQASYLHRLGKKISFQLAPGAAKDARFPKFGPFDERMGYVQLPASILNLSKQGFQVTQQARVSDKMRELFDKGLFPSYAEKTQAGLVVLDNKDKRLFSARYPERAYENFKAIPRALVDALLFIENRELLDTTQPKKNPAVEWDRLGKAVLDQALHVLDSDQDTPGGSTLATQIEKYRHSPDGRTGSITEKFRQMASASIRAYRESESTLPARRRVILDYINTVPLAAKPGIGEINGIGDGMWAWYGRDFADFNRILSEKTDTNVALAEQALAYKQALSLFISQRRPSYYFSSNHNALNALTDSHLRLLAQAGVISTSLRDAALTIKLDPGTTVATPVPTSFVTRKAATAVRSELAELLKTGRLYDLDRFDLTVSSTLDSSLQGDLTAMLRAMRDAEQARSAGLMQERMLHKGDPSKVIYSFTLFEATPAGNVVRVQTDNYDQPFDINAGAKLDLGSTAKLRTLISYLEVVAQIHKNYGGKTKKELEAIELDERDYLTQWGLDYLRHNSTVSLATMLEAAMDRRYKADPSEPFFTGGGLHYFENFNKEDNPRVMPVREAMRNSVNLVFVRLMRDVMRYYMFHGPGSSVKILSDASDPRRQDYLKKFADREGRAYINRFFQKYQGKSSDELKDLLLHGVRAKRDRMTAIHMTIEDQPTEHSLVAFLKEHLDEYDPEPDQVKELMQRFSPQTMSLADRGYVAGIHPLELWLVGFMRKHPGATLQQVVEASSDERQDVYAWLFKTRHKNAQDRRIMSLLEIEAFLEIHRGWQRLGYPFGSMVPSYASALGSSADRPAALAELMGIIVNNGKRLPTVRVTKLHFAAATPYETVLERKPIEVEQVLLPEITQVTRRALMDVATNGTAKRLRGTFMHPDGTPIAIGGKTGTGDNRHETYGPKGQLLKSRVVSRSATFVFFIGDKLFGTLTAYVAGEEAAKYQFTSSLAVQILKNMAPTLSPLLEHDTSVMDVAAPVLEQPYPELKAPKIEPPPPAHQSESPEGVVKSD
jgi:membrane peptidoglycan carboxypeptidase